MSGLFRRVRLNSAFEGYSFSQGNTRQKAVVNIWLFHARILLPSLQNV